MTELALIIVLITLVAVIAVLLWFIYKQDKNFNDYRNRVEGRGQEHNAQITQQSNIEYDRLKDFITGTFDKYLKHIQLLEKASIHTAKPVTTKMVEDIMSRTPTISPFSDEMLKNEIDEIPPDRVLGPDGKIIDPNSVEINDQTFANIPIGRDTKVEFEQEDVLE